jgi:hypothetical protein
MKKFKYPLVISGPEHQLRVIAHDLEALGYKEDGGSDSKNIITLFTGPDQFRDMYKLSSAPVHTWLRNNNLGFARIHFTTDDRDLILALAAMVDGPEFHEGEYVRFDVEKARGTNLYTFCWSKPYVLKIYAVSGDNLEFTQGNMIIAGYGNCLSSGASNAKYLFHKLTEKEIIAHFNQAKMPAGIHEYIGGATLSSTAKKTVSVSEDFVIEVHKSACSEWKKRIEKELPELFHVYSIGQRLRHENGDVYLLSQVGNFTVCLVNISTGNRFTESLNVSSPHNITKSEMECICNREKFTLVN